MGRQPGLAQMGQIEVGMRDHARRKHAAVRGDQVENGPVSIKPADIDAGLAERKAAIAGLAGQRRQNGAQFPEIHEPTGQAVLLRGQSRQEGGDRRSGGGGKHGGQAATPQAGQAGIGGQGLQQKVAEAIDDNEDDSLVAPYFLGRQACQGCVGRGFAAQTLNQRTHQVDDAAAVIVR